MEQFAIYHSDDIRYPDSNWAFRPDCVYPETPFPDCVSDSPNQVYESVRNIFKMLGFDREHFGSGCWNPLGQFVSPGMTVLIKPNMVNDKNPTGLGLECLYTHPSFVAAVVDYVCIALKGSGRIVVGDSPMQSCDFAALVESAGYREMIDFYINRGIDISLEDFRGVVSHYGPKGLEQAAGDASGTVYVDLGNRSSFASLSQVQMDHLRIPNFKPSELKRHHNMSTHEYGIIDIALHADVIINIPKIKTHRKAGLTGALKNLIGTVVDKTCLPHHCQGSKSSGFDEYSSKSVTRFLATKLIDYQNAHLGERKRLIFRAAGKMGWMLASSPSFKQTSGLEGCWFGNDTLWRTILDINKIVLFADSRGILQDNPQRRLLTIGDMVVSGDHEGPLRPHPNYCGALTFSTNSVVHDVAMAYLLGVDPSLISHIREAIIDKSDLRLLESLFPKCVSNDPILNGKSVGDLPQITSRDVVMPDGWSACVLSR